MKKAAIKETLTSEGFMRQLFQTKNEVCSVQITTTVRIQNKAKRRRSYYWHILLYNDNVFELRKNKPKKEI
jgi:hypothetical protein